MIGLLGRHEFPASRPNEAGGPKMGRLMKEDKIPT